MTADLVRREEQVQAVALENVLIGGDLSRLSPEDRVRYYKAVCQSVALNPLTKPFEYITLNGKLTLYARKDCTDQLRKRDCISIQIVSRELVEGIYIVTARATLPDGRCDESIGAVPIENLKGEARSNSVMKAETKSKRRVTLSICGLGMLDESEVGSIPGAEIEGSREAQKEVLQRRMAEEQAKIDARQAEKATGKQIEAPAVNDAVPNEVKQLWGMMTSIADTIAVFQGLKARVGETAYRDVLRQFGVQKSNELAKGDLAKARMAVKQLWELPQVEATPVVENPDADLPAELLADYPKMSKRAALKGAFEAMQANFAIAYGADFGAECYRSQLAKHGVDDPTKFKNVGSAWECYKALWFEWKGATSAAAGGQLFEDEPFNYDPAEAK